MIEEATDGRITVNVHAGDMSTDEIEIVELAQSGNIEIAWTSTGSIGGIVPNLAVFEMPFLFDDPAHVERAVNGDFGAHIIDDIDAVNGLIGLGIHVDGWRNILTKDVVINELADLSGVRMRSMMSDVCVSMYEALGAVPIAVASGEIFTSLQTNVVSGQDNSFVFAVADGYIDTINAACMIYHFYSGGVAIGNAAWFNGLPAEDQVLIRSLVEEACAYQRAWFMEEDLRLLEVYREQGYTITYPTDRDAWVEAVQPVYEQQLALHPEWEELIQMVEDVR